MRKLSNKEMNDIINVEEKELCLDNCLLVTNEEKRAYLNIIREEVKSWTYKQYCVYFNLPLTFTGTTEYLN